MRRRLGRKVANALRGARPIGVLPVHGERAFDRVHVDHTRLDVVLIDSVTGEVLGRPWLTLAIDAFTRRIVGHVLTFSPPSAASVMLVMRTIVARYGRLPTTFVLDNGSEFTGVYLQTTAAAFEVSLEYRPPRDPRFGAVVETCFGKLNGSLIHFLKGNSVGRKDVRSQDNENDAAKLAIWTLPALEMNLSTYLYEVYDVLRSEYSGLGSPRERFEESLRLAGVAAREAIADDQHFRIMTAPAIAARCRVGRQGIKAKRMRYWCDAFDRPGVRRSLVEVRWEPFDRSRAYAFVEGEWQVCHATHHQLLANRTERELQLASVELSARLKRTPSVRELALHLEETLKTEKALLEHRKSLEALKSGVVVPFPGPDSRRTATAAPPPPPPASAPRELESWE
jgi:putative transposase